MGPQPPSEDIKTLTEECNKSEEDVGFSPPRCREGRANVGNLEHHACQNGASRISMAAIITWAQSKVMRLIPMPWT